MKIIELIKNQFKKDEVTGKRPIKGTLLKAGNYAYKEGTVYIIFIVLALFFTILNPVFVSERNIMNILRSVAPYLIAGMGIIFVMLTGGIDLSVGYIMATAACVCAMLINVNVPTMLAILIVVVIGLVLGAINGLLASKLKIFPLIITLATQMVFSGVVAVIAGKGKHNIPVETQWLNTMEFLKLPISFWVGVVLIIIVWFVLNKMHFGRNILAVGGNKECARLAGINVDLTTILCYAISGAFFALAGCVVMSVQGYADTTTGPGYEFVCLTAAIIGGISMMGGKGNVMGMVVGIFIMQIIGNGMQLAGIESDTQNIVKGAILLAAVAFDIFKNKPRAKIRNKKNLEGGILPPKGELKMKDEKLPPLGLDGKPMPFDKKGGEFKFAGGGKPPKDFIPPRADTSRVKRQFLDIQYSNVSETCKFDLYLPDEGEGPFPVLVHIHGGGFAMGDRRDDHVNPLLDGLDKNIAIASIDYRLSGESIFPAAVLDCREFVRFIKENAKKFFIDPERIAVIGGSAGGNLSAMLAMNIPNGEFYQERNDFNQTPYVKVAIDQFGPTKFEVMDEMAKENGISFQDHNEPWSAESNYIGKPLPEADKEIIKLANPMTYVSKNMSPILIQHGTIDKLVPYKQSVILFDLINQEVPGKAEFKALEGADHEDKMFQSKENMAIVWEFLDKHL